MLSADKIVITPSDTGKGQEHEEEVLTREDEGSDEDLQGRQSKSESESDWDNPVDRNKAAKSSTPGVETKTDGLGDELSTDIRLFVADCLELDNSSQTNLVSHKMSGYYKN